MIRIRSNIASTLTKLALVQPSKVKNWEVEFLCRVKSELSQHTPTSSFQVVDAVEEADVVLHVDSNRSTKDLATHRKLLQWAHEEGKYAFALSFQDQPLGVLPGIYTSLSPWNFEPSLNLSWPHLEAPNKNVESAPQASLKDASQLFTFLGSCSHPLRRKLFSMYESGNQDRWKVGEIRRWYDHTDDEHKNYVTDILNSHFVLCPRGIAAYSHRIFEAIILERVPVIIADDWIAFSFPEKDYYITIPENELENITSRLERELENYDFYLSNLRTVKSKWFARNTRYRTVVEYFLKFHRQNQSAHQPKVLLDRLKCYEFRKSNGLLSHQKIFAFANAIPLRGKKILDRIGR